MKRSLFSMIFMFLLTAFNAGQVPMAFNYQAVARNTSGELIINQNISVRISILSGSSTGTTEYSEIHSVITDAYGVFNLLIGTGIPVSGSFQDINWGNTPTYLKIEADITGGTSFQPLATTQIHSIPYAFYAGEAESVITENQNLADVLAKSNFANTQIKNLTDPSEDKDAATKSYVDAIIIMLNNKGVIALDKDGNIYPTVRIGSQIWMQENLKTTKLNDGTAIQLESNSSAWLNLTSPGYCWYSNNEAYKDIKGALYNWYAISTGKLCPSGWHVPTDDEWMTLVNFSGGTTLAGGKLKEIGTINWASPNVGATNESGFTARAGGYRNSTDGGFYIGTEVADYWTSSIYDGNNCIRYYMSNSHDDIAASYDLKRRGDSVRCIKD